MPLSPFFSYQNNTLFAEGLSVKSLAKEYGTPFYLYSANHFRTQFSLLENALEGIPSTICFAAKANSNLSVLRIFANLGAGVDAVSIGEIQRAITAGIPAKKIVFSGVGKTVQEMEAAIKIGILQFNVESEQELSLLEKTALRLNTPVSFALRINPNVDAGTHQKITTGTADNKFGVSFEDAEKLALASQSSSVLSFDSLSVHIGSQLTAIEPYKKVFDLLVSFIEKLNAQNIRLKSLDVGGGLGIDYIGGQVIDLDGYAALLHALYKRLKLPLILEPGRFLCGNAGLLVSKVLFTKKSPNKEFLILDAAMNDLKRPALYDARHKLIPVDSDPQPKKLYDVVGPVCETGDTFGKGYEISALRSEDLVAFCSAGAYGATLSSTYNSRCLIPEILVDKDRHALIRPRQTLAELLALDKVAPWLS